MNTLPNDPEEEQKKQEGNHLKKAMVILSRPPKSILSRTLLTQTAIVKYLNEMGIEIAIPTFDNYKNISTHLTKLSKYLQINQILDAFIQENYQLVWNATDEFEPISEYQVMEFSLSDLQGLNGVWKFYTWCNIKFRGERIMNRASAEPLVDGYHIHINKMRITEGRIVEFVSEFSHFDGHIGIIANTKKFYIEITSRKRDRKAFFTWEILLPQDQTLADLEGLTAAYTDSGVPGVTCGVALFIRMKDSSFDKIKPMSTPANTIKNKKIVNFLKGSLHEYGTQHAVPAYEHSQFVEPKNSKRDPNED